MTDREKNPSRKEGKHHLGFGWVVAGIVFLLMGFNLKIYVETLEKPGTRITNAEITISDSEWYFIGGSTCKENDGPARVFTTAVRVIPKAATKAE